MCTGAKNESYLRYLSRLWTFTGAPPSLWLKPIQGNDIRRLLQREVVDPDWPELWQRHLGGFDAPILQMRHPRV